MMLSDSPQQLRCLWSHLRLVNLTEFHARHNKEQSNVLAFALDVQTCKTTIKLKIAADRKPMKSFESTTKQARTGSAWGTESGVLNR